MSSNRQRVAAVMLASSAAFAMLGCGAARGAIKEGAAIDVARRPSFRTRIPFLERGRGWNRCDASALVPHPDGGVLLAGSAPKVSPDGALRIEREHALIHVSEDGELREARLDAARNVIGRVLAIRFDDGGVLVAQRRRSEDGLEPGPETKVLVSRRPRLGASATQVLELRATRDAFPLGPGRWLAVGAAPPHSMTVWTVSPGRGREMHRHPTEEGADSASRPVDVHDVVSRHRHFAVRGRQRTSGEPMVGVFAAAERPVWQLVRDDVITTGAAFDEAGDLYLAGFTRAKADVVALRTRSPSRIPRDVPKTWKEQPRDPAHVLPVEHRLYSLFGSMLEEIPVDPDRTIEPEGMIDGVLLRYAPDGRREVVAALPSTALVWPGPMVGERTGVTVAIHVEGRVPTVLRREGDGLDGFVGASLLAHFDPAGSAQWVLSLGHQERIVRRLARGTRGYYVFAQVEDGTCELSHWSVPDAAE